MTATRILVIGDAMVDRHIFGEVNRISPEAPVPIVDVCNEEYQLGGAANTAAQVAVLAEKTIFMYKRTRNHKDIVGQAALKDLLKASGIQYYSLWTDGNEDSYGTTVKVRIWTGSQQICRIDFEDREYPTAAEEHEWVSQVIKVVEEHRINKVIFSDYDKGCLSIGFMQTLARLFEDKGVYTFLDPKKKEWPYISGLTIVKPNAKEVASTEMSLEECSSHMGDTMVVNTRGEGDINVAANGSILWGLRPDKQDIVDVCGAGDVFCAVLALAYKGDTTFAVAAANKAAGIAVRNRGCYILSKEEVQECLDEFQIKK